MDAFIRRENDEMKILNVMKLEYSCNIWKQFNLLEWWKTHFPNNVYTMQTASCSVRIELRAW